MSERPILFNAEMVRAILEGRKTQTRRVVKSNVGMAFGMYTFPAKSGGYWLYPNAIKEILAECPYGKPGDRLRVRETYTIMSTDGNTASVAYRERLPKGKTLADTDGGVDVIRLSTEELIQADSLLDCESWRPSIHMPRWASRITLEITDVRVQRLQDISADDAVSEGVAKTQFWTPKEMESRPFEEKWWDDYNFWNHYPQIVFERLWKSINGDDSWHANPWVWALTFKQVTA